MSNEIHVSSPNMKNGKNKQTKHKSKGKKRPQFSQTWKDNMSKAKMGHPYWGTPEGVAKAKETVRLKGLKREKLRAEKKEMMTRLWADPVWRANTTKKIQSAMKGKQNTLGKTWKRKSKYRGNFKGLKARYWARHVFVSRARGKPQVCEHCGVTANEKLIEWSSPDHSYPRNPMHYVGVCRKCHKAHDKQLGFNVNPDLVGSGLNYKMSKTLCTAQVIIGHKHEKKSI